MKFLKFYLLIISSLFTAFIPAYADFSLDKSSYVFGDEIRLLGTVSFVEGQFIGLQILDPTKSDIVTIDQFLPKTDGTFSKAYKAQGPKWQLNGIYTIKIAYNGEIIEKTFQFQQESITGSVNPTENTNTTQNPITKSVSAMDPSDPKGRVPGFPDPNNSPQHYFDRYSNEKEYKTWFDSTFPEFSIEEVVGYKKTHISNFPDNKNSPWYYVERYNQEIKYKDWFDSQFPATSIYDVLGYHESLFQKVPNWIKNNASWWAAGLINDSDFLNGIQYLINENIIVIPNLQESGSTDTQNVPVWIKNTAKWWADGLIDENEFLKGIQFLVEEGIIRV